MQYSMTDKTTTVPNCTQISVQLTDDDDPDLSWLEQDEWNIATAEEPAGYGNRRIEEYGVTWSMVGIRATATVMVPMGGASVLQTIKSPGLWGIESDSGDDYLREVAEEEVAELKTILDQLNVDYSTAEISYF